MIYLSVISVRALPDSMVPSLSVAINVNIDRNTIPIQVSARLYSEDNKLLSVSQPFVDEPVQSNNQQIGIATVYISGDSSLQSEGIVASYKLVFQLNKEALDHLEDVRKTNAKKDATLQFILSIDFMEIGIDVDHFALFAITGMSPNQFAVVTSAMLQARNNDLHFLMEKTHPSFALKQFKIKQPYTIPSSDWINDFVPLLGLGRYFIVEIPEGKRSLGHAWEILNEAEEAFRRWERDAVMTKCREVGQYLNRQIKKKFGKDSFTYNERWGRIYGAGNKGFTGWTSFALHKEDIKSSGTGERTYPEDDIKVTSSDAEAALFFTKLLIKYCEELLDEDS